MDDINFPPVMDQRNDRTAQHSNFENFNAILHPDDSENFDASGARRRFSAEHKHAKSLGPWCKAILKKYKLTPSQLENTCIMTAELLVEMERERGTAPIIEPECSIRRRILELESELAPELDDPETVMDDPDKLPLNYIYYWLYTEEKWYLILQKKDDPRVQQLIELIEKAGITQDVFRQSLGQFSLAPSKFNKNYTRPLIEFDIDEIEYCLEHRFGKKPENIIFDKRAITDVLMKI